MPPEQGHLQPGPDPTDHWAQPPHQQAAAHGASMSFPVSCHTNVWTDRPSSSHHGSVVTRDPWLTHSRRAKHAPPKPRLQSPGQSRTLLPEPRPQAPPTSSHCQAALSTGTTWGRCSPSAGSLPSKATDSQSVWQTGQLLASCQQPCCRRRPWGCQISHQPLSTTCPWQDTCTY